MAKRGFHRHMKDGKYVKTKLCMRQDFYHSITISFSIILKVAELHLASQHKRKKRLKSKIFLFSEIFLVCIGKHTPVLFRSSYSKEKLGDLNKTALYVCLSLVL